MHIFEYSGACSPVGTLYSLQLIWACLQFQIGDNSNLISCGERYYSKQLHLNMTIEPIVSGTNTS